MADAKNETDEHQPPIARFADSFARIAEDIVYAVVALLLVVSAGLVLVEVVSSLISEAASEPKKAIEHALDSLLIVFILVELLGAVRVTIVRRHLVAEPFLLVGIIASIKEIVVKGSFPSDEADIAETMLEIGVLGAVVVGLSIALLLVRRKEREPDE